MKHLLLILMPATLIGCAGTPPEEQVATLESGAVCERTQPTGSRRIVVSCRSAADREFDRRDVEAVSEGTRRTRPNPKPGA